MSKGFTGPCSSPAASLASGAWTGVSIFGGVEPFGEDWILNVPHDRDTAIPGHAQVVIRRYGKASGPLVIVSGGISSGRCVAGEDGWWRDLVGYGLAVDLYRFHVVSFEFAPRTPADPPASSAEQARLIADCLPQLGAARVGGLDRGLLRRDGRPGLRQPVSGEP